MYKRQKTGHHYKDGLAYKFENDTYETVLREIEWTPTRFGEIAPVGIFDTVEIDGCDVSDVYKRQSGNREKPEKQHGTHTNPSVSNQIADSYGKHTPKQNSSGNRNTINSKQGTAI